MQSRTIDANYGLDRLPEQHKKIFEQYASTMGDRMCNEFIIFLQE